MQWLSGRDKEAEASYDRAVRRFPQDAPTFVEYAQMLLKHAENGDAQAEVRAISLL
jgi:predicted Zn-dependent protease